MVVIQAAFTDLMRQEIELNSGRFMASLGIWANFSLKM